MDLLGLPCTSSVNTTWTDIDSMWTEFKRVSSLITAQMWKEVLEGEGLPTRILPDGDILDWGERVPFLIMVPKGREHVAEEILRKL